MAPTPYLIGVPTGFYSTQKIYSLPKDVWLADLDKCGVSNVWTKNLKVTIYI